MERRPLVPWRSKTQQTKLALGLSFAIVVLGTVSLLFSIHSSSNAAARLAGENQEVLPGCNTYHDNICQGNNVETPSDFEKRRWQTPHKDSADYLPSYQDYDRLVGHVHLEYVQDHKSANLVVKATHKDPSIILQYEIDGVLQNSNSRVFHQGDSYGKNGNRFVTVSVYGSDGSKLELPEVDFFWDTHSPINHQGGDYRKGQKGAIVELFGWPHDDVAKECELLGKMGYLGAKLFPAMEQLMSYQPMAGELNPWNFMFQPVSYRLDGRMGTRSQLRKMIQICRSHNVRVYADAVINHMVGSGNDVNKHHRSGCTGFPNKTSSLDFPASSVGHSPFFTQGFCYMTNENTNLPSSQEFPAVPYGPTDFHCERALNSWTDPLDLNAGWLVGLVDLNTEKENVQQRIADYLVDLISIGFSGFRIDAAKHIKPDDLVGILSKFKKNLGGELPDDWFTWLEVLLGGEREMLMCNEQSGYNYGKYLENQLKRAGFDEEEVGQVKIWYSGYPSEPQADCGTISRWREVIQNDDHDQQTPGSSSRDMHGEGSVLVKDKDPDKHRFFEVKLFENPYGVNNNADEWPIRPILSSYWFTNGVMSIPDGKSDCSLCTVTCEGCKSMPYKPAFDPSACGYSQDGYTRVHRDKAIVLAMRKWMELSTDKSNAELGIPEGC